MKFAREGLLLVAVALLGGCGGGATPPSAAMRTLSMTMAHYVQPVVRREFGRSWMLPQKKKSVLIYAGGNSEVYVYDYWDGKFVGTLTGVEGAAGGCVDAKGDVYIATDFGKVLEYPHGGTKVLKTYSPGGLLLGCSVDSKGDLAVTSFDQGVTVFAGGNPKKAITYSSVCAYQWTMGYDNRGNLIGVGETSSRGRAYCALLFGAKRISSLSFSGTIHFPGGTMWDGKYIALGDQEAGGHFASGEYPSTLKGSTLSPAGSEVTFTGNCDNDYTDIINPFIVGKKNTPINDSQGTVVLGTNSWCANGGYIEFWHYPQGGKPFKAYSQDSGTVLAVSIGT